MKTHSMELLWEHEGTEEWMCTECPRQILVEREPKFNTRVIEEGDNTVAHTGIKIDLFKE